MPARRCPPYHQRCAVACVLAVAGAGGCGRGGSARTEAMAGAMQTIDLSRPPCQWLPRVAVEQILGPLASAPQRVASAERFEPAADGRACLYRVPAPQHSADGLVAVGLDGENAMELELAGESAHETRRSAAGTGGEDDFDYLTLLPTGVLLGRRGHLGVQVTNHTRSVPPERTAALAARILDQVPDLPPAKLPTDPAEQGDGRDPCGLISASEAAGVLGAPRVTQYRARASTAFARGDGPTCAYYMARHRVLLITPTWSDGRVGFRLAAALNRNVGERTDESLGGGGASGPWERAASGADGRLYFLKGDRMLEIIYRMSGADRRAAMTLAAMAVPRL